jgi:FAD/FMN-containing dehydrogenase
MTGRQKVYESLVTILGSENVSQDAAALERYAKDALGRSRAFHDLPKLASRPEVVVRPISTEQVSAIVRLAAQEKVPIVPYGGGTGLMGGVLPLEGGIVIDLKGMNKILSISEQDRTALVEAGVVLHNGKVLQTRGIPKSFTGIALNHLFIGAEGNFGIITKAMLRVFPMPEKRAIRAFGFNGFGDGFGAIGRMFSIGLMPALVDFSEMNPSPPARILRRILSPTSSPAILYLDFEGFKEEVAAQEGRAIQICQEYGGHDLGMREAQHFWDTRHRVAERYYRSPFFALGNALLNSVRNLKYDFVHVSLPTSQVLEYRRKCPEILSRHHAHLLEYGIWTQPELFSLVIVGVALKESQAVNNMAGAVNELLMLAQDLGGSMEYCHGVGVRLAHLMDRELGHGLEVMKGIKSALDPDNIMNSGKLGL